jgi:cytochrome d ubiquinol oxidase subunit II
MTEAAAYLPIIWAILIALSVFIYVVLDGFDLGVGLMFAFFPQRKERDVLMNSVAPVWDGNETWLVLGGGGLFAAFPLAYAILMPALYAPVIAMLIALVFRGVAFEFRWRTERWRKWWDRAFIVGSATAAFTQGIMLGALLEGVAVEGRAYSGGWWDWLSPFSVVTGLSVVVAYGLLGAAWIVMKAEGAIRQRGREIARVLAIAAIGAIALVSLFTPYLDAAYHKRWFEAPGIFLAAPVPIAVAAIGYLLIRSLTTTNYADHWPFLLALALFGLCFAGLGVSMWPYVIPTSVTIFEAAAPPSSQLFMLVGAGVMLPIILGYTAYAYWVFRGKVDPAKGYH